MYILKTDATMKRYNSDKWWIDNDIIPEFISAKTSLRDVMKEYADFADKHGVNVSKNALRNMHGMYVDTADGGAKQIGYILTGSSDFDKGDYSGWSKQYVDLWVEVIKTAETDFSELPVEY